jgi:allophanate hydrolase-like protein
MLLAVNGTLMRGFELNQNMQAAGAVFVAEAETAPLYRLWSIRDAYPGMLRANLAAAAIRLELWEVPAAGLVQILSQEPPGLTIGRVALAEGTEVLGVLAEPYAVEGQREITSFGGWRAYINSQTRPAAAGA